MEHARNTPDLTLGVVAFSTAQRDAIEQQLELLRREDISCETFFSENAREPFFVKNLENVQGDERDVIYISIGYGKTKDGYMAMSFGIRAANYPLTEEDLAELRLPPELEACRDRLHGLSIDPLRLREIREERRPQSRYASIAQCRYEVGRAEALFRRERIACLNTSFSSIEEIATAILHKSGLKRRLF